MMRSPYFGGTQGRGMRKEVTYKGEIGNKTEPFHRKKKEGLP